MKKIRKKDRSYEAQLRYLSQSARLQETIHPRLAGLTIMSISLTVMTFIVWAALTNINEVARAAGEIVPQGFQQVVQHFDGGIVENILVAEGDIVDQGALLLRLDGAGAKEDLARAQGQQTALLMQKERLSAFVEKRKPDFKAVSGATEVLIREQIRVYESMFESSAREKEVIEDQIRQKQQSIAVLKTRKNTAGRNLSVVQDKYDRLAQLNARGNLPAIDFLEAQQELNSLRGDFEQTGKQIDQAQSELAEYRGRLQSLAAEQNDEAFQQMDTVASSLMQNEENIAKLRDRVSRLEIRSPVRGVIKGLAVNTIGGVVQPGQALMEIVPLDKALVVEARIPPQHIGNIRIGQPVQIKVSTYDFSRFGAVEGRLDALSATTFTGEKGDRYYRGRIILDHNYVGNNAKANVIMPGMTVMADIVTGRKTVLDYLLKPIHRSLMTAFSER